MKQDRGEREQKAFTCTEICPINPAGCNRMKGTSNNSNPACAAANSLPVCKGGTAVILTGQQPNQKAPKGVRASSGSILWHQAPPTLLSVQCPCGKQGLGVHAERNQHSQALKKAIGSQNHPWGTSQAIQSWCVGLSCLPCTPKSVIHYTSSHCQVDESTFQGLNILCFPLHAWVIGTNWNPQIFNYLITLLHL